MPGSHIHIDDEAVRISILLLGNESVGKSSLPKQLVDPNFKPTFAYQATIGFDLSSHTFPTTPKIKASIWDTAGNKRYRTLNQACYKNKHIYIIVLSNDEINALNNLKLYEQEIESFRSETSTTVVVVNKCDLPGITTDETQKRALDRYCESQNLPIHYISATKHDEVESFFKAAVLQHLRKQVPEIEFKPHEQKSQPQSQPQKKEFFEDYLKYSFFKLSLFCFGTHHIDRARAVKAALMKCENNEDKLKIINNQIHVLNRRDVYAEDVKALGLDARWADKSQLKNRPHYLQLNNSGYYRELLRIKEELNRASNLKEEQGFFENEGAGLFPNSPSNN
jgi:small GTP-binding protein